MNIRASGLSRLLLLGLLLGWAAGVSVFLLHRIVVTNDALSNYGHVWLISEHLREHRWLPWKLPALMHGRAQAFPYGFVPWTTAALLRPVLGDWVSTLWMVAGIGGVIAGTFAAFPELRKPVPAACVLANPVLVETLILFQMPFAWAAAMFLFAVWAYRREKFVLAVVLAGMAQATHAPVLMPIAGVAVAAAWWSRPEERKRLVACYGASLVIAAPAAIVVLVSPVVEDASRTTIIANLAGTVGWRALVFLVPLVIVLVSRRRETWLFPIAVGLVALNVILVPLRHDGYAWGLFFRKPDGQVAAFARGNAFEPGATYRILRAGDGKVGMYQLIRAGGQLDSEFFPESIDRRSWPSEQEYARFLSGRSVEYVMVFSNYGPRFGTNEGSLLETMAGDRCATVVAREQAYVVYQVQPSACGANQ